MKIPFNKLYEYFFSSYDVTSDTKLLKKLEEDMFTEVIIIKRSWIFGLLSSWILLVATGISLINIYNIYKAFYINSSEIIGSILIILIAFSTYLLLQSSFIFLYKFKKTYGNGNNIEPIGQVKKELEAGDILFKNFFNQITANILLFGLIILFYIGYTIYKIVIGIDVSFSFYFFTIFDIGLLISQIYFMRLYRKKMIDLEMDYNVVVPGHLYFINQTNFLASGQDLEASKIKTINKNVDNFLLSFFNLGTIIVLTEGDNSGNGQMTMFYVDNPPNTVDNMYKLTKGEQFSIKNKYLKDVLSHLGIEEKAYKKEENIIIIKNYLQNNIKNIEADHKNGNSILKSEIQDMWNIFFPEHKK